MKNSLFLLIALLFFASGLPAQVPSPDISQLDRRVIRLETLQESESGDTALNLVGGLAIFLVALFGGQYAVYERLKSRFEKRLVKKLDDRLEKAIPREVEAETKRFIRGEFEALRETVVKWHAEVNFERVVREDFKLLIVAVSEGKARDTRDQLVKMGFAKPGIETRKMEAFPKIETDDFDLVIIDNNGPGDLDIEELQAYFNARSGSTFLLYGGFREKRLEPSSIRINFANSQYTLYPRIMETLRYEHFVNRIPNL